MLKDKFLKHVYIILIDLFSIYLLHFKYKCQYVDVNKFNTD